MTAEELRQRRLALGLSTQRLSLLLGVGPNIVANWEGGRGPIPSYIEARLAEIERTRWPKRDE
jgi:DNA-binding transcriptional regulator YiaG